MHAICYSEPVVRSTPKGNTSGVHLRIVTMHMRLAQQSVPKLESQLAMQRQHSPAAQLAKLFFAKACCCLQQQPSLDRQLFTKS